MLDMFKGVVNSPETTITNDINNTDTIIYVLDETRVPTDLPNLMTLGTGTNSETVKILSITGNAMTVTRGFQGVAKGWNAGTIVARNFTEYDYNALKENITDLDTNKTSVAIANNLTTTVAGKALDATQGKVINDGLVAHKAEIMNQRFFLYRTISLTGVQKITLSSGRIPKQIYINASVPGTKKFSSSNYSGGFYSINSTGLVNALNTLDTNIAIAIADTGSDRTFGTLQNIQAGSFEINWTHTGIGGTGDAEISIIVIYHD